MFFIKACFIIQFSYFLLFTFIEEEDSNHSISSESQSDVSRKDVVVPKKYEVSIGTSSSEDEGEKRQLITVSVHGSPEHS